MVVVAFGTRLEREEQHDHLELVRAAVDPIAVENIRARLDVAAAGVRRVAIQPEQQQQVPQLTVDVSEDLRGRRRAYERRLRGDDGLHPRSERDDAFGELIRRIRAEERRERRAVGHPRGVGHVGVLVGGAGSERLAGSDDG